MGYLLFAIFLAVPLTEIALFIVVGGQIGVGLTIAAIILTALTGALLVRRQGLATLARARRELDQRRIPAGALGEGLAILLAGALLLTPGFFTDTVGFLLLVPPLRRRLVSLLGLWLFPKLTIVTELSRRSGRDRGPIIEGEAVELDDEAPRKSDPNSPWRGR